MTDIVEILRDIEICQIIHIKKKTVFPIFLMILSWEKIKKMLAGILIKNGGLIQDGYENIFFILKFQNGGVIFF
jgi:hypothetical protein